VIEQVYRRRGRLFTDEDDQMLLYAQSVMQAVEK